MNVHDEAIRRLLLAQITEDRPHDFVVQEWAFRNSVADIGVIGDEDVDAFEIKSARDSTARLARQVADYGRVFSTCTLVTAAVHLRAAAKHLPDWWGITVVADGALAIKRVAARNYDANLAELLWSDELAKLCRARGLYAAAIEHTHQRWPPYKPKKPYRESMAAVLSGSPGLNSAICAMLRARKNWRLPDGRSVRGKEIRDIRAENERRLASR